MNVLLAALLFLLGMIVSGLVVVIGGYVREYLRGE
jgi:hypothetical protein